MFATVTFTPAARKEILLVPTEAVIQTGKRSVVIVAQGEGKFAPVDVEIGIEANGQTEIRKGSRPARRSCLRPVPDRLGGEPERRGFAHGHGAIAARQSRGARRCRRT